MKGLVAIVVMLLAGGLLLTSCGDECDWDGDCLIACDCNGDGIEESIYPHDCTGGHCGVQHQQDLADGCAVLCFEGY